MKVIGRWKDGKVNFFLKIIVDVICFGGFILYCGLCLVLFNKIMLSWFNVLVCVYFIIFGMFVLLCVCVNVMMYGILVLV